MSQNKTVTPGMEPEMPGRGYAPMGGGMFGQQSFYQRTSRPSGRGTVVSGMDDREGGAPAPGQMQGAAAAPIMPQRVVSSATGKPVVGFLYSISRTAAGEFWPLHIGQNTIGMNPENDVQLPEGTVSGEHAVLVVRKLKSPEKVIASLSDTRSTNGTMLNGESLGFSAVECKNGDIITIGENYDLYVILVDPAQLGLKVSEHFIAVEQDDAMDEANAMMPPFTQDNGPRTTRPGFQPGFYTGQKPGQPSTAAGGPSPYSSTGYVPSNGTVGMDGSVSSYSEKGGTVGY